ncbi:MAG: hypothetical protein AAF668_06670 [Pseudomonadota bacterium]
MTGSRDSIGFNEASTLSQTDKLCLSPITFRITDWERQRLEQDAAGLTISAYIRGCLFGDDVCPRRARLQAPVKDHQALAAVLGALGASRLSSNLNQIAKAANSGSLPVSPDLAGDLQSACRDVKKMRFSLIRALGLRQGSGP